MKITLGRISFLNVLPIYHALDEGIIKHNCELIYGTPAELNVLIREKKLAISSCSSIEYAKNPEEYLIVPNLSIASNTAVQSVLLLSKVPIEELDKKEILVSEQTHSSRALLHILLKDYYNIDVEYKTASASSSLKNNIFPDAFLCIGDEALALKTHKKYPFQMDLSATWKKWTNLPFVFGLWIVQKDIATKFPVETIEAINNLYASKKWGLENYPLLIDVAEKRYPLSKEIISSYFPALYYDLAEEEICALNLFYEKLHKFALIDTCPELKFLQLK